MTPRTRKLLTAAALATAFIAGPAAAKAAEGAAAPAAAATIAARTSFVAKAIKGMQDAARLASEGKRGCRIGNGKSSMYSDNLYRCVTIAERGTEIEYVTFNPDAPPSRSGR